MQGTKFTDFNTLKQMNNTVSNFGIYTKETDEDLLEMDTLVDNNLKSGIKLNTKYGTSLKMAIDKLDLIPEFEENEMEEKKKIATNNVNLFKKKADNHRKDKAHEELIINQEKLEDINKFNNAILKDTNWGNYLKPTKQEDLFRNTHFFKPDKKEIEKEIGKNIYNTKLPRARLLTKIKDPGSSSFNKTANKTAGGETKFFNSSFYNTAFNKTMNDKNFLK